MLDNNISLPTVTHLRNLIEQYQDHQVDELLKAAHCDRLFKTTATEFVGESNFIINTLLDLLEDTLSV